MNKKTAIEWLINYIGKEEGTFTKGYILRLLEQAKEIEKEQIINAVDGFPLFSRDLNGIDYYEKIYGGNK
jgi:hypothetical protein